MWLNPYGHEAVRHKLKNGQLKQTEFFKIANSQKVFALISEIGPWINRID